MVGHGESSAGSYLADPTSPIPSHCASVVMTSTVRVEFIVEAQELKHNVGPWHCVQKHRTLANQTGQHWQKLVAVWNCVWLCLLHIPTNVAKNTALVNLQRYGISNCYACLDTCCSHFLTIIAGVDLHFRHESELPVCWTRGLNQGRCCGC